MKYRIYNEAEYKDTAIIIKANSSQEAAIKWAKYDDKSSNEYHIVNGNHYKIIVEDMDTHQIEEYVVSGYIEYIYNATKIS